VKRANELCEFNHPRYGLWRLPRDAGECSSSSCLMELSRCTLPGLRANLSHLHLMLPPSSSASLSLASSSRVDRCPVNYTHGGDDISWRYWRGEPIIGNGCVISGDYSSCSLWGGQQGGQTCKWGRAYRCFVSQINVKIRCFNKHINISNNRSVEKGKISKLQKAIILHNIFWLP